VAPFVDGVILVIEANRTRREQLWQAEQSISAAKGKLLGYILNKRTYDVPKWLYRIL
jgi:Mrp family chromosome partitioning ATPase